MLSLLSDEGLNFNSYEQRFGSDVYSDFPELSELLTLNLGMEDGEILRLTETGVELSDVIGAWLFFERVLDLMDGYELK